MEEGKFQPNVFMKTNNTLFYCNHISLASGIKPDLLLAPNHAVTKSLRPLKHDLSNQLHIKCLNVFLLPRFSLLQVSVEVLLEYPFFVFGQGWSSCCPDRTTQLLELPCTKLSVGDVCISLTLKNLKNGSLKKTQSLEPAAHAFVTPSSHGLLKPPRAVSDAPQSCSGGGSRHRERENGISQRGNGESGNGGVENGDLTFAARGSVSKGQVAGSAQTGSVKPSGGRKRRWSAPEGRKVEKTEEEPPLTLPKPSFIPHEVKISIEGRSNIGK